MAFFLIIVLLGAGIRVSPAVAAYVDNFSGGNVILAAPTANPDRYSVNEDAVLNELLQAFWERYSTLTLIHSPLSLMRMSPTKPSH